LYYKTKINEKEAGVGPLKKRILEIDLGRNRGERENVCR